MRVKLKKGKQQELITKFKQDNNCSWSDMARSFKVSSTSLRDWRLEKNLLPIYAFNILDKNNTHKKFILKYKKDKWGMIAGGRSSTGTTKYIHFPPLNENLAEFIGIILGDGNILAYKKGKKVRSYKVTIAGDSRYDYEYLKKYVANLSKNLFHMEPKFYKSKSANCIYLILYGLRLIEFFTKMGLKPGNKIKNKITIPKWIWTKNKYLKACIRGLIDTDGSVYELLPHWPGLFQISFTNKNFKLLNDVRRALLSLGYSVSEISNKNKKNSSPRIYITKKEEINKFYKEIGFNNPKHSKKLLNFIHSPIV